MPSKLTKQVIKTLEGIIKELLYKIKAFTWFVTVNNVIISGHKLRSVINPIHNKKLIITSVGLIHVKNPLM